MTIPSDDRLTGPLPRRSVRLTNAGQIVPCSGADRGPLHSWEELGAVRGWDVIVKHNLGGGWQVAWMGPSAAADRPAADLTVDLGGRLLLAGLVDAHTHAVFAGDRAGEFNQRLAGASYHDIAAAGGGILHTVQATRAASVPQLVEAALPRLHEMARCGVRVVEIKTGYGLDGPSECRMLDAIEALRGHLAGRLRIVATAMPCHAVPAEFAGDAAAYTRHVCDVILPAMAARGSALDFVDVFIEQGYFSVAEADQLAVTARRLGLGIKAHVDEFHDCGGVAWAIAAGAVSVEHLLVSSPQRLLDLAASPTVAVGLPLTSLFLREPLAPLRQLVDAGARVAIATDCNPGSAMTTNLVLAMQHAVLAARLTPQEALRATTRCGALALSEPDGYRGRIAVGEPFVATLLDLPDADHLFYQLGQPPRASELLLQSGIA